MFTGIDKFSNVDLAADDGGFNIFDPIHKFYNQVLEESIADEVKSGVLDEVKGKDFYNYVLIEANEFHKIMRYYGPHRPNITKKHFRRLKKKIFYSGKGRNGRKMMHLKLGKRLFNKKMRRNKICAKFSKICQIWDKGQGIICLQLFHEADHFMAHNREFSIIKALGFNNLTNSINGSCYGDMKVSWNKNEISNFGNMLLYNAFKMCIIEPPSVIFSEDVVMNFKPCTNLEKDIELTGILDYFLDM